MESRSKEKTMEWKESQDGEMEGWKGRKREGSREKMKITHLEQSLLNYSPHILSPLGYVRVELVQIRGER